MLRGHPDTEYSSCQGHPRPGFWPMEAAVPLSRESLATAWRSRPPLVPLCDLGKAHPSLRCVRLCLHLWNVGKKADLPSLNPQGYCESHRGNGYGHSWQVKGCANGPPLHPHLLVQSPSGLGLSTIYWGQLCGQLHGFLIHSRGLDDVLLRLLSLPLVPRPPLCTNVYSISDPSVELHLM